MGNGFPFLDIILFAVIAVFLIFRLRSVLGRRDGHEQDRPHDLFGPRGKDGAADDDDNVITLPDRAGDDPYRDARADDAAHADAATETVIEGDDAVAQGLRAIRAADPSFDPDEFLVGARVAFDMILGAYATGDRATLKNLLSPDVFADFDHAISERERMNHTIEDTLVGITTSTVVEASMEGRNAVVTVKFVSEQINATRDEDGTVIDGSPNTVTVATDFWTFSRDTRARDPNWSLVATASAE
jgi:predicted lipid-binding transport protein (Tim44 family)